MRDGAVLVVSARAARGMAHQDLTKVWGVAPCLLDGIKVSHRHDDILARLAVLINIVCRCIYSEFFFCFVGGLVG